MYAVDKSSFMQYSAFDLSVATYIVIGIQNFVFSLSLHTARKHINYLLVSLHSHHISAASVK